MAERMAVKSAIEVSKPTTVSGKRKQAIVQTKECVICAETKSVYRNFPAFSTCSHDADTCSSCIAQQTVTTLEVSRGKGWSVCKCPRCNVPVPTEELQSALPRALVKEMKELVENALQSTNDSWRWCLAPGCGHGNLQHGRNEMIRCRKCDFKMCYKHQVAWHNGYTCKEYETSHPQAAITKTNEEMIKKMSKPCPGCGIAVEKAGGCNHMRCEQCGSTWHWEAVLSAGGRPILSALGFPGLPQPLQRAVVPGRNIPLLTLVQPAPQNNSAPQAVPNPNSSSNLQQSAPSAPAESQTQLHPPLRELQINNKNFPPELQGRGLTLFWTMENGLFRYVSPPGSVPGQTATGSTEEIAQRHASGEHGSRA